MKMTELKKSESERINHIANCLYHYILAESPNFKHVVYICLGNDSFIFDSIGPLVGTKIKNYHLQKGTVYGSLFEQVGTNNVNWYADLKKKHPDSVFVIVDASECRENESPGDITICKGPVHPGGIKSGIGDIAIAGLINKPNIVTGEPFMSLHYVLKQFVKPIAEAIIQVDNALKDY